VLLKKKNRYVVVGEGTRLCRFTRWLRSIERAHAKDRIPVQIRAQWYINGVCKYKENVMLSRPLLLPCGADPLCLDLVVETDADIYKYKVHYGTSTRKRDGYSNTWHIWNVGCSELYK